jgi:hypothetical protein
MNSHAWVMIHVESCKRVLSMEYGNACWPAVLEAWKKIVDLQQIVVNLVLRKTSDRRLCPLVQVLEPSRRDIGHTRAIDERHAVAACRAKHAVLTH